MRALRDFNIPKIVTDDTPVFMGLIGDLFPALEVPRKRDADFEKTVKQATIDLLLQPEDNFILKVLFGNIVIPFNPTTVRIAGSSTRGAFGSAPLGFYSRKRWYGQVPSLENFVPNIREHETQTYFQRS